MSASVCVGVCVCALLGHAVLHSFRGGEEAVSDTKRGNPIHCPILYSLRVPHNTERRTSHLAEEIRRRESHVCKPNSDQNYLVLTEPHPYKRETTPASYQVA
jgi:hypothetical protein